MEWAGYSERRRGRAGDKSSLVFLCSSRGSDSPVPPWRRGELSAERVPLRALRWWQWARADGVHDSRSNRPQNRGREETERDVGWMFCCLLGSIHGLHTAFDSPSLSLCPRISVSVCLRPGLLSTTALQQCALRVCYGPCCGVEYQAGFVFGCACWTYLGTSSLHLENKKTR